MLAGVFIESCFGAKAYAVSSEHMCGGAQGTASGRHGDVRGVPGSGTAGSVGAAVGREADCQVSVFAGDGEKIHPAVFPTGVRGFIPS